ncbi:hypothetical protein ACFVTT_25515 [Streptomyces niveus]|uniref:hypothetical protein n=1 Tax=Streptomyces niveus TaxID=193462 RepID=UPI00343E391C
MSRSGWQVRSRPSGAPYRQRVTVTGAAEVDAIDGVIPRTDPIQAIADHEVTCTTCAPLKSTGAYSPAAARLVREEREARR